MKFSTPVILFLSCAHDFVQGERGLRRMKERKLSHKDGDKDNYKSKGSGGGGSSGGGGGGGGDRGDFGGGTIPGLEGSPSFIAESSECIPFYLPDGSIHPLIAGAIDANNNGDMVNYQKNLHEPQCESNTCGTTRPGCCRVHFKMMVCDESDSYWHMPCICNEWTAGRRTDAPSQAPTPDPFDTAGEDQAEDRVDEEPEAESIPAHLQCKKFDPDSEYFGGSLNPFDEPQLNPKPFMTCTETEECSGDHCCLQEYCVCSVPTIHAHCLPQEATNPIGEVDVTP